MLTVTGTLTILESDEEYARFALYAEDYGREAAWHQIAQDRLGHADFDVESVGEAE